MSIADKLTTIATNTPLVYAAGEDAAEAVCAAKHFVAYVHGNDTNSFSIAIPFKPDAIIIGCYDPFVVNRPSTYQTAVCDFHSASTTPTADLFYVKTTGERIVGKISQASQATIFTYTDGVFTFVAPASAELQAALWRSQATYFVSAIKYTDKTEKELITDQVNALTGSGTITYSQTVIEGTFTTDEWNTLIAAKPNWTFVLS